MKQCDVTCYSSDALRFARLPGIARVDRGCSRGICFVRKFPFVLWFLEATECFCTAMYIPRATVKGLRSGAFSTGKNWITARCLSSASENCDTWLTPEHSHGVLMNWRLQTADGGYRTECGRIVFIGSPPLESWQKNQDCRFCFRVAVTEV